MLSSSLLAVADWERSEALTPGHPVRSVLQWRRSDRSTDCFLLGKPCVTIRSRIDYFEIDRASLQCPNPTGDQSLVRYAEISLTGFLIPFLDNLARDLRLNLGEHRSPLQTSMAW